MSGQSYRLKTPTLAILTLEDNHKIPMTIPQGGIVQVTAQDINGNRLLEVTWEGKAILMFTTDLRERGEVVASASA